MAEIGFFEIEHFALTAEKVPELKELFNLDKMPLGVSYVRIEFKNVPTAVVNAFRCVSIDEMLGHCLQVPPDDGTCVELTTECFMLPQFVNQRISLMPLRPQISADVIEHLRLELDVTNSTAADLTVYAGDLTIVEGDMPEPLFNPTHQICVLQPAKRIVVKNIYIATGYGRDNATFNVARCAAYTHLDIPQYTKEEMTLPGGVAVAASGYKVSCLVANPQHHVYTAAIPATSANSAEVRALFADVCVNIKERLSLISTAVERYASRALGSAAQGIQYTVIQLENGLSEGLLQVPGETETVGELIRRLIFDASPSIANVTYTVVAHKNVMNMVIRHTENVTTCLLKAIAKGISIFEALQNGMSTADARKASPHKNK
jgi:DNA-directed RNA polymerase subunit L